MAYASGKLQLKEIARDRAAQQALPSLPPRTRARALTLIQPSAFVASDAQTQSSLLCRLPYEIRHRIYEEVLGGHLLHIHTLSSGLAHINCEVPIAAWKNTPHHECWGYWDDGWRYHRGRPSVGGLLGLLRTCRQV